MLVCCSGRGTLADDGPRRHVVKLVIVRYLLVFVEVWGASILIHSICIAVQLALCLIGTLVTFVADFECVSTVNDEDIDYHSLLDAVVVTSWIAFVVCQLLWLS